ncbi:MAG: shikimate kinase [Planctomycetaceae bacterium]|nr:shikimate kinase [Planctomycetaceae bacterium]
MTNCFGRKNLILIGMPGAGKSTVGVVLAKRTSRSFVDTDLLIQTSQEQSLQEIVNESGYLRLRQIEQEVLLGLEVSHAVISTGGSAVYSEAAMQHLKQNGLLIFLDVELHDLQQRVGDYQTRGLARQQGQSFADLFEERIPLYKKHADLTISCSGLTPEAICEQIVQLDRP